MKQFESLTASELYCPKCRRAQQVRERLLLVTPHGEIHDYRCTVCGESLATREVTAPAIRKAAPAIRGRPR
jgi:phage FluMu protein Com